MLHRSDMKFHDNTQSSSSDGSSPCLEARGLERQEGKTAHLVAGEPASSTARAGWLQASVVRLLSYQLD